MNSIDECKKELRQLAKTHAYVHAFFSIVDNENIDEEIAIWNLCIALLKQNQYLIKSQIKLLEKDQASIVYYRIENVEQLEERIV